MNQLNIKNFGQINEANIVFGDLTVMIGPQATGKSITLQLLKLLLDTGHIQDELRRHGADWSGNLVEFLDLYFGEGMGAIWREKESEITWQGKAINMQNIAKKKRKTLNETMFFIPAQRVLTLRDGWPRPFTDYSPGDPFPVREFSEKLRILMEKELTARGDLFPQKNRLKAAYRDLLKQHIFSNFNLSVDKVRSQKRLVLGFGNDKPLPYMVWSAGQREFVPLLLGLYWLMPPSKTPMRESVEWVVIEELEMGLHPRAINVMLLLVLELMSRGYKVCLSTHSPQVLDMVWAMSYLKNTNSDDLLELFEVEKSGAMRTMAKSVLKKTSNVYYFDRKSGNVSDISSLNPGSNKPFEANWGGLMEFSTRANDIVARSVANSDREEVS